MYVPLRLAATVAAKRTRGKIGGKKRKEEQSGVMDSPPSQEVDDINKKLIILPPATSEGLARAIHCSLPLLLLLVHLTLYVPRRPRVG